MERQPLLVLLFSSLLIGLGVWGFSGCAGFGGMSAEQRAQIQADLDRSKAASDAQIADLKAKVDAATAAGDTKAIKVNTEALTVAQKIRAGLETGQTAFNASIAPDGTLQIVPATLALGTAVGGPVGTAIASAGLAASVLVNFLQGMKTNTVTTKLAEVKDERDNKASQAETNGLALKSIIAGINDLREVSPTVVAEMDRHKPLLKAAFSSEAKATIAQMKALALPGKAA